MKKDSGQQKPATGGKASAADNPVAQRNQKQSQAAQLSAANVEESPHMDRGDSAGGSGESLGEGRESAKAGDALPRGAVDTQYGTKSSKSAQQSGQGGRVASAGSGSSGSQEAPQAPNPGSSEKSSGAERDTMSGPRPGSRS